MSRPRFEVADIIRSAGTDFIERNRSWLRWTHLKVLRAIARCRTAALGSHIDECTGCGHRATISYNSCRNRHCPKCQTGARERWIQARRRELLPTPYVHVVFTLPPVWAKRAVDEWTTAAGIDGGTIFRRVSRLGKIWGDRITPKAIWHVVRAAANRAGIKDLAPHDLRRTCARLCHLAGGELEQIQFLLGHASVQTTERYLGCKQRLSHAVNDNLGLEDI